ncbi:MAG: hypothetical protein CMF31_09030 [Kordiimonas sp.]|mgnify:CR=1 FL=1|nr:hypothetical protein [Kordiimonas sp.]|tara:strand:- start:216 stop:1289 length:1074 start_codon:yes stop_codon:yes gene_type:complete
MEQHTIIDKKTSAQIHGYAQSALTQMGRQNIPPTPANYQLWYSYCSADDLALVRAIDRLIEKGTTFTPEICTSLHEKFFSTTKQETAVHKASENLQNELDAITATLKQAGDNTTEFSNSLSGHLDNIGTKDTATDIKALITKLVSDTQKMKERSQTLEGRLQKSSNEVKLLQQNLKSAQQEAMTDMLTNIGNRKCFETSLQQAIEAAEESGTSFSIFIGDVDHFKKFNDTWGHQMGDQVLKAVAHSLKTKVGDSGTPARYGGEEFIAVLPHYNLEAATDMANTVRNFVSQRVMRKKSTGETLGKITISFGVAAYRRGEDASTVLERADNALYLAKNSGRDCVRTEEDAKRAKVAQSA